MAINNRRETRPDPNLEWLLDKLRGEGWLVSEHGNGALPADAPRGSYLDADTGRLYGPGEEPETVKVIYLCEDRRNATVSPWGLGKGYSDDK